MRIAFIALLSSLLLSAIASTQVAAPGQVNRPGEISPPNVWVMNRNPDEAIPVTFVTPGAPLLVQVASQFPDRSIATRAARQEWEYLQVSIKAGQDAGPVLNAAGAEGWEATGITTAGAGTAIVILKRPR